LFRKHSRILAAVVVCIFTWSSGGVFTLAHAAKLEANKPKAKAVPQKQKPVRPEERFSKLIEDLETTLADTKADSGRKKTHLKAGRDEIDKLDVEMRAQFAATEQKLKAAKLPAKILERHAKFVKHYDDNLNELKGNVARVEQAKDNAEAETELHRVHQHLKRVKPPSNHQKLDPNNLAHRSRTLQKREPRMKKEDFDKDLKKDKRAWKSAQRIQVASAGSLAGLLASNSVNAITLPAADDLAETPDVQLSPEIRAKALELGNNPVKIYEWVRNNIDYVPTWGSIQGANMTLQTKQGNAFDTSSLLIALLRAAGIHARYNIGTIELPISKVMNWVGGFTDPMSALDFMSSGGVPTTGLTDGGVITKARLEHVWVEAFINYIPSRGAKHFNGKGDTWIKLDPSYKEYKYTNGIDIKSAVPFDGQGFLNQIQSGATIDQANGSITGVNSALTQQTMQDYQTQVQNYLTQNHPNATVGDVIGKKDVDTTNLDTKSYPYLLGTLPYRTAVKGSVFTSIPDTLRHKLTFSVKNDRATSVLGTTDTSPLLIIKSLAELAGKKITLSYSPATPDDEAVINSYLPTPHADGTPIEPGELPQSLPGYLINVVPELRIAGQVVATGSPVALGTIETFKMTFFEPNVDDSIITNTITAGAYEAIGLNLGRIGQNQLTDLQSKIESTKAKLQSNNSTGLTREDLISDLLFTTAIFYHAELGAKNHVSSKKMGVNTLNLPSETIFSTTLKVDSTWGTPSSVGLGSLNMDADRLLSVVKAKDGNNDNVRQYMYSNGMTSSALEHSVPEQLYSTPDNPVEAMSAVKALKIANDQGIPIYTINQQNISSILPQLQLDQQVMEDIQTAVNTGKIVTVSKANINYMGWSGCGYTIINPETGAGAYMMSDGSSGAIIFLIGLILMSWPLIILILAEAAILSPLGIVLAMATGLGTGMVISQIWNPDWDARTLMNMIVQTVIEGIVTAEIAVGLTLSTPALFVLAILWFISQLLPYNVSFTYFRQRKFSVVFYPVMIWRTYV
jgi:transglutaminase-like putative cysteine protease